MKCSGAIYNTPVAVLGAADLERAARGRPPPPSSMLMTVFDGQENCIGCGYEGVCDYLYASLSFRPATS